VNLAPETLQILVENFAACFRQAVSIYPPSCGRVDTGLTLLFLLRDPGSGTRKGAKRAMIHTGQLARANLLHVVVFARERRASFRQLAKHQVDHAHKPIVGAHDRWRSVLLVLAFWLPCKWRLAVEQTKRNTA
jgi:hypothetical protein